MCFHVDDFAWTSQSSVQKADPYFPILKIISLKKKMTSTVIFQTEAKMDQRMFCAHWHKEFMAHLAAFSAFP